MTEPKPITQYHTMPDSANRYQLPSDFDDRCMALQEQAPGGRCLWRERGQLLVEYANGAPKSGRMILYQRAADVWSVGLSTVREDLKNSQDFGEWTDEMPDPLKPSRRQCRCARIEARLREIDPLAVLQEQVNAADKWGGRLCPPRVWDARLTELRTGKQRDDGGVLRRIEAAASSVATALKRADGQSKFTKTRRILEQVATLLDTALAEAEKAK